MHSVPKLGIWSTSFAAVRLTQRESSAAMAPLRTSPTELRSERHTDSLIYRTGSSGNQRFALQALKEIGRCRRARCSLM